ncbi:MAG: hypothetical protein U0V70_05305 [Terriglobia bacterium]
MGKTALHLTLSFVLAGTSFLLAKQENKPDFSGTWLLDREKSDLTSPPLDASQSHGSASSGAGGGGGSRSGGGRGMGGGGMGMGGMSGGHGGGRGGSGMGGGGSRGTRSASGMKMDLDFYQLEETAEKLRIEHSGETFAIKLSSLTDKQLQEVEFKYLVDGKTHEKKMGDGGLVKSKTAWEGVRLVTKTSEQSSLGALEIVEDRSLSEDGSTLTISLSFKGSSSHWTEKAVYSKDIPKSISPSNHGQ